MRLTCPNCSARYDVDEAMVPAGGRDVQCSNCSTTWFQPGPRHAEPIAEPAPAQVPPPAPAPAREPRLSEVAVEGPSGAPGADGSSADRPARQQIDPDVADILREEAARESRLRREAHAPEPVEQQEEMPLESSRDDARARRMVELEGAEDAFEIEEIAAAVASTAAASRREIFPDIEEINSTLRATGDRREEEANATDVDTVGSTGRKRGKVRLGFFLVLILAAVGVGIYAYAPQVADTVPALAGPLESYVSVVNTGRFWLDDMARSLAGPATE